MNATPFASLVGIGRSYGDVRALDGVDLDVRTGEVHVLLGENGAGKSTLAAILAGVQRPDAGDIRIGGERRRFASPRDALAAGVGVVFQHAQLVPSLSLVDNVALGGAWWRRPPRARLAERMRAAQRRLDPAGGIDPFALAGSLSLGERQRAEIVRALMRDSRLLVLDEPTSMLAPQAAADLGRLMRRLARGEMAHADGAREDAAIGDIAPGEAAALPMAVVFVTHRLDEALDWGDRITVLRRGRKAGELRPAGVAQARDGERRTLLRMMFGDDPAPARSGQAGENAGAPAVSGAPVLAVEGLAVEGSMPLAGIDLAVGAGEILGIAGIDGNGQREFAEALAGQRPSAAGDVRLGGASLRGLGPAARSRRGLRYASDDRLGEGSVGALSIALNLLLKRIGEPPFWRGGIARDAVIDAHGAEAVAAFDIRAPDARTPVAHLSGGNLQKVILARELDAGARAIVFAKPTYGLDAQSAAACRQRIRRAARGGLAVVLISTDLDEIVELSDRIVVMAGGRIVARMANGPGAYDAAGLAIGRAAGEGGEAAA